MDLGDLLGVGRGNEGVGQFYLDHSNGKIEERIQSMIHNNLRGEGIRSLRDLISNLLKVEDPSSRLNSSQVLVHPLFTHTRTTTIRGMKDQLTSIQGTLEEVKEEMEEGFEDLEERIHQLSLQEKIDLMNLKLRSDELNEDQEDNFMRIRRAFKKSNDEEEMRRLGDELNELMNEI